jgi:hypothetical protein
MHEMRREYRCGIADAEIDLALREILYVEQTRPSQIGVRQEGATKIGIVENCATQVRAREICAIETRLGEVSFKEIGSLKVSSR